MSAFCAEPGCFCITQTGRFCDAHKGDNYLRRIIRPELDKWYSKRAWRDRVRLMQLRRDPICEYVDKGVHCAQPATDVHHIDGSWKETGDWTLFIGGVGTAEDPAPNLMSLCHEHHSRITMEENLKCRKA
jgi:hypothetical protein